ncbi:MAG: hypothetical protein JSV90_05435 [Methanobacteriota archaeon]|nr:MAG: hypothetical protein JSV90_05435 [Euryarchaeota archaeon]
MSRRVRTLLDGETAGRSPSTSLACRGPTSIPSAGTFRARTSADTVMADGVIMAAFADSRLKP